MDDTVDIREVHERNDGRDPFPLMMNRQRMPKVLVENASMFDLVYLLIIGTFFRSQGSYLISVVIPRYTLQALVLIVTQKMAFPYLPSFPCPSSRLASEMVWWR